VPNIIAYFSCLDISEVNTVALKLVRTGLRNFVVQFWEWGGRSALPTIDSMLEIKLFQIWFIDNKKRTANICLTCALMAFQYHIEM
jgi:hypothetical protein